MGGSLCVGLIACLLIVLAQPAAAACSQQELINLARQGLSDAEIQAQCAQQLPGWLSGVWQSTRTIDQHNAPGFGGGPIVESIRLEVVGPSKLTLAEVRDHHLTGAGMHKEVPREVRDVQLDGDFLVFRTRVNSEISPNKTTTYRLDLSGEQDYLEGEWQSQDAGGFGLPPLRMAGRIQLVKIE